MGSVDGSSVASVAELGVYLGTIAGRAIVQPIGRQATALRKRSGTENGAVPQPASGGMPSLLPTMRASWAPATSTLYLGTTPKAGVPRRPQGIGSRKRPLHETQLLQYIEEDEEGKITKLMLQKFKNEAHSPNRKVSCYTFHLWCINSEILASASSQRRTES